MTTQDNKNTEKSRESILLEELSKRPVRKDLTPVQKALSSLGDFTDSTVIQVVGSKGKGSVVHYLSQILIQFDYSVMSYTSPHFEHPSERFSRDGNVWSREQFRAELNRIDPETFEDLSPFEILLFLFLKNASEDIPEFIILEAGMGGRWDATSAVPANMTILTSIELEHTRMLGETETEITREKTAQIPEESMLVSTSFSGPVEEIVRDRVREKHLTYSQSPCANSAQQTMKKLAIHAASLLTKKQDSALEPLVSSLNPPPGRQEIRMDSARKLILDVAHTPESIRALLEKIKDNEHTQPYLVLGMLRGKRHEQILEILEQAIPLSQWYLVKPPSPRAQAPELMCRHLSDPEKPACYPTPRASARALREDTEEGSTIIVTGSFPIVGWFRKHGL